MWWASWVLAQTPWGPTSAAAATGSPLLCAAPTPSAPPASVVQPKAHSSPRPGGGPATPAPPARLGAGCWPGRLSVGCRPPLSWPRSTLETSLSSCVLGAGLKPVASGSEARPTTGLGQPCPQQGGREDSLAPQRARTPPFPWEAGDAEPRLPPGPARLPSTRWGPGAPSAPPARRCAHCGLAHTALPVVPSGQGSAPAPTSEQPLSGPPSPAPTALAQALETPQWPCFLAFQRAQATPRGLPTPPAVAGILWTTRGGPENAPVSLQLP